MRDGRREAGRDGEREGGRHGGREARREQVKTQRCCTIAHERTANDSCETLDANEVGVLDGHHTCLREQL
jgi:hypothetical protein